jgi:hypothetical protein
MAYSMTWDPGGGRKRVSPHSEIRLVTFESEAGSGKIHTTGQVIGYDQDLQ